jgi:hypothetical protein
MPAFDGEAFDQFAFDAVPGIIGQSKPNLMQDHGLIAWEHWPAQFYDGSRIEQIVRALIQPMNGSELALLQLLRDRWLDVAEGQQLDGIGDIVGLPRVIDDVVYVQFFGFIEQPAVGGFGVGRFRRARETTIGGSTTLLDPEYRRLLYWKIAINNGHGTTPEIIAALKPILAVTKVVVQDIGNAKIAVWVNRLPGASDPLMVNARRWVPKAAGVGLRLTASTDVPFGFLEQGYSGFGVGVMARGI